MFGYSENPWDEQEDERLAIRELSWQWLQRKYPDLCTGVDEVEAPPEVLPDTTEAPISFRDFLALLRRS